MSEALINAIAAEAANLNPSPAGASDPVVDPNASPEIVTKEPGAEDASTDPAKVEPLSPRITAIVKRENAVLKRERDLKMREEELKKAGEGKLTRDELMKALMDEFEEDPYEFMSKNGFSYEKLQNAILSGDEGKKYSRLEKEVMSLRKQLEDKDKKTQTDSEEAMEKEFQEKRGQALTYIEQEVLKSEDFELVAKEGAFELVYDVIQEYFHETGKMLTVSEAAALVEKNLEDDFRKRLDYKKVKNWMAPSSDPSKSDSTAQSSPKPTETKTITSDMSPSGASTKSDLELSDEERMEKAIRIMKGEKP